MTTEEDFLAHYGVKGMRWGQRRRDKRIAGLERVASGGKVTFKDSVGLGTQLSTSSLMKLGLEGAAANKAANMRAVDARLAKGRGSALDVIKRFGGDRLVDTGRPDSSLRFTPEQKKLKATAKTGKASLKAMNDHNNLSDRDFRLKYSVGKSRYAKRFNKSGGEPIRKSLEK
jgi:hypothetical protein